MKFASSTDHDNQIILCSILLPLISNRTFDFQKFNFCENKKLMWYLSIIPTTPTEKEFDAFI